MARPLVLTPAVPAAYGGWRLRDPRYTVTSGLATPGLTTLRPVDSSRSLGSGGGGTPQEGGSRSLGLGGGGLGGAGLAELRPVDAPQGGGSRSLNGGGGGGATPVKRNDRPGSREIMVEVVSSGGSESSDSSWEGQGPGEALSRCCSEGGHGRHLLVGPSTMVLIAAVVWVTLGLVVLISDSTREGHPGLDGIIGVVYFQVQLITSVGYGDVSPKTQERKIFMGVYVLAGNLIAGVGIADSLLRAIEKGEEVGKQQSLLNSVDTVLADSGDLSTGSLSLQEKRSLQQARIIHRAALRVCFGMVVYGGMIFIGCLFYSFVDNCECSDYDVCMKLRPFDTEQACDDVGGTMRTMGEAFYMSAITLTTVGLGDEVPATPFGRAFAIIWMLCGVASMTHAIARVVHFMKTIQTLKTFTHGMDPKLFHLIDEDGSGTLSKSEFVIYMLLKDGLIEAADLEILISQFNLLDADGSGQLEYSEVVVHHHHNGHDGEEE